VEENTHSERKLVLLITKNVLFAKSEVILHGSVGHQKFTMWIMRIVMMRRLFFIQAIRSPASQPVLVTCTVNDPQEAQQVVPGLIVSIERMGYEEDKIYSTCTLLDLRFKEVYCTS